MYVPKALVLLAMAVSASAVSTQHIARNVHHRRHAVAARDASPETPSAPVAAPSVVPRKRQIKRCKAGNPTSTLLSSAVPTSSTSATSTFSVAVSSAVPSSSAVSSSVGVLSTSSAANNVGAAPSSSSVAVPSTSEAPAPSSEAGPASSSSAVPAPSSSAVPAPSSSAVPAPSSSAVPTTSSVVPTTSSTPPPAPSSSEAPSSAAAPLSTSSEQPAPPTPSPTPTQTTTLSAAASSPSPSSSDSDSSLLSSSHSGDATWYETGLGACGINNVDTDFIAAASHILFDGFPGYDGVNPNDNPICNMKVTANWEGKSVTVAITDRCTGCDEFSLDFSPSAFTQLADQSVGRLTGMTWVFNL